MGVSDALWEIECAISDSFDRPTHELDRQTAQNRRSVYEQTLVDVNRRAGCESMHRLGDWIEREIRTARRLPAVHEVRQIATEICRRESPSEPTRPKS